jgi:predicted membrane metal-binding protein
MSVKFNMPFSIYATLALIVGITLAHAADQYHFNPPYAALTILNILMLAILRYSTHKKSLLLLSCLSLCSCLGAWRYVHLKNSHAELLEDITQKPVDLTGIIVDITPVQTRSAHKITMTAQTLKASDSCKRDTCHFTLHIYTGTSHRMCTGDTIAINSVQLKKNNTEFTHYLLKEGVACSVFLPTQQCTIVARPLICIPRYINNLRSQLLNTMAKKLSTPAHTLFASLFLGNNKTNRHAMDHWSELFRAWGLSHYLARSGLHLILFIAIWLFILRLSPIALAIKQLVLALLVTLYALISWPSVSFYRALCTFILCSWCIICKKPIHYLHLLAIVCFITLLYNPLYLMFLDFQLSYGLTFALGWFNSQSNRRIKLA